MNPIIQDLSWNGNHVTLQGPHMKLTINMSFHIEMGGDVHKWTQEEILDAEEEWIYYFLQQSTTLERDKQLRGHLLTIARFRKRNG